LSENITLYPGKVGNVFRTKDIKAVIEPGRKYSPGVITPMSSKSIGIDSAWSSSAFGIAVTMVR
jgi:hypothetical protein